MILSLVTPPVGPVVPSEHLAGHLRVTNLAEIVLITDLEAAAVAHLDGWRGILGRAILPQTWRQEFSGFGDLRLAMPDVSGVVVTAVDSTGASVAVTKSELRQDACGPWVITEGASGADRVFVNFTCALPAQQLAAVKVAIRLLVAHWYVNREAVAGVAMAPLPLAVDALVTPLRWSLS